MKTEKRRYHKLTENEKIDLMNYISDNEKEHVYNNKDLAEMFDVSLGTITIYKRLVRNNEAEDTEVVTDEEKNETKTCHDIIKIVNTDATPYVTDFDKKFGIDLFANKMTYYKSHSDCIEVGLINNRHDIPVKNYIFDDSLSSDLMFNYEEQERIVQEFIDRHCMVKKKIVLYATGLQSALSSVIKICLKNNIDISIKHYNTESKSYILQQLSGSFDINADPFFELSQCKHGLFFYKCTQREMETYGDTFYIIKFSDLRELNCPTDKKSSGHIIVKNYEDIFDIFPTMLNDMMKLYNQALAIYINKCYIKDRSFRFGFCFSKNYSSNLSKGYMINK